MAPVKLTEINIGQRRSDDSKGRRGAVCYSPYFHKPTHTHSDASVWFSAWIDGWRDWQGVGMIKCWAKSNMLQVSGSQGSLQISQEGNVFYFAFGRSRGGDFKYSPLTPKMWNSLTKLSSAWVSRSKMYLCWVSLTWSTWPTMHPPPNPIRSAWHMLLDLHPQSTFTPSSSALTPFHNLIQMARLQL